MCILSKSIAHDLWAYLPTHFAKASDNLHSRTLAGSENLIESSRNHDQLTNYLEPNEPTAPHHGAIFFDC